MEEVEARHGSGVWGTGCRAQGAGCGGVVPCGAQGGVIPRAGQGGTGRADECHPPLPSEGEEGVV